MTEHDPDSRLPTVAVIGAGIAGLSAAKILGGYGFEVTVYDKAPDVGGVWSRTRRYPGLTTQNSADTYALSDFPMPSHYPQCRPALRCRNTCRPTPSSSGWCPGFG